MRFTFVCVAAAVAGLVGVSRAEPKRDPNQWRAERRTIDMHMHVNPTPGHMARAVKIMDAAGIGVGVNLGVGTVTPGKDGGPSQLEQAKKLADANHPGRFLQYMILDYKGFDDPDWPQRAARQVEEGHRLGAAGLKEFKRLGLFLRDGKGKLIKVDDPKLDPVWEKCGELGMPVSIHVADPRAFWEPYNDRNERWRELKSHRSWWFGDPKMYPPRMEIVEALIRVVERHPKTTFVCVHFGNNAEDIDWVDAALDKHPNMMIDLAARIPEVGRHDPKKVHDFFVKHQDRIVFGTDFQVYDRLTLGSGGDGPPPTDEDAATFYAKHWRYLETWDKNWEHMTPIQGDWTISSIGLPPQVVRKVYFDNARRLLARSLPLPVIKAKHAEKDFDVTAAANWKPAAPTHIEYSLKDGAPRPELSTEVRCLWTNDSVYFRFTCPYTTLTTFEPVSKTERLGLWDRDVVEVFLAPDPNNVRRYGEYEVAPTNERLDVLISPEDKDFKWDSKFSSHVKIDESATVWTATLRIPLSTLGDARPAPGTRWRLNLYRSDRAGNVFMAWNPTLTPTAHTPERFGVIEFID
jgi:predicted TIM-barrel fold metal-dependent hydrolase